MMKGKNGLKAARLDTPGPKYFEFIFGFISAKLPANPGYKLFLHGSTLRPKPHTLDHTTIRPVMWFLDMKIIPNRSRPRKCQMMRKEETPV